MKKNLFFTFALFAIILSGCSDSKNKITIERAEEIINNNPFLKVQNVVSLLKKDPENADDYKWQYVYGYETIYVYATNSIKLSSVKNLIINDNTAECDIEIVSDQITKTGEKREKYDVTPKNKMPFKVYFKKTEDSGWVIDDCVANPSVRDHISFLAYDTSNGDMKLSLESTRSRDFFKKYFYNK